ncbi:MAG: hypothetical protein M9894_18215 [Planctomycetes bacterium]|nr:hypothetical protein [Planctomycetota bacterium]
MARPGGPTGWLCALAALAGCAGDPPPAPLEPDAPLPLAVAPAEPPAPRPQSVRDVAPGVEALREALVRAGAELPDPLEGAPPTFVLPGDPEDPRRACFIRLRRVTLGGEFDAFDDEEIVVRAEARGVRHELGAATLDLPADRVETFELLGPDWIEVPMAPRFELVVWVIEEDARQEELVARAVARLEPTAYPDGTSPVVVPLGTIRGTAWTLFGAGRPFAIEGASVELAVLSTPRSGRGDGAARARAGLASTLGPVTGQHPPRTAAGARAATRLLVERAAAAMKLARAENDPGARALLAELAGEARRVAVLATAAVLEPLPGLPRALQRLDEAAARCPRDDAGRQALVGGCGLLAREADMPLEPGRARRAHEQAAHLLREAAALSSASGGRPAGDLARLIQALGAVEGLLRRTVVGLEHRDALERGWVVLQTRLREAMQ